MNPQALKKLTLDFIMTILLLLLMTYELIGRATHEWLGTGMLLFVLIHHIFNQKWSKAVFKRTYTPYRMMQTVLVALLVLCILGSMISGMMLSRYVFDFLPIQGRTLLCQKFAYDFSLLGVCFHGGSSWSPLGYGDEHSKQAH